jgi:hypothetical protein
MSIEHDEERAVTIINLTGEANPPTIELEQSVIGNSPAEIQRIPIQPHTSRNKTFGDYFGSAKGSTASAYTNMVARPMTAYN